MFKPMVWVAIIVMAALPLVSRGAVAVGDKPQWVARDIDGNQISSASLDGKMVLIDLWATWCHFCMEEVPHVVRVNEQYGPQGLVIVGISQDQDRSAWQRGIKEKGMNWVQSLDSDNKDPLSKQFGDAKGGIPYAVLLSPAGEVLWAGHPAQMDGPLADAFKKFTPRILDKRTLAEVTAALDKAETAVKGGDMLAAARAMSKVPAGATKEKSLAPRVEQLQKDLSEYVAGILTEAEELVGKQDYTGAITKLGPVSALPGLADSKKAAEKLAAIKAMPEAKAAFEAAAKAEQERAKAARSEDALNAAKKLKADKKDEQAYLAFKDVARQYAALPAGAAAAEEVAAYEKDPSFVKRVTTGASEAKARAALNLANSYKNAGRADLAKTKYQAVIDQFPGTPAAAEAKKELEALPKE
jgi:thiol-disulfide isomerase/thioredoxin